MVCIFLFMCIILQQKFIFKNARKYLSYSTQAALLLINAYVLKGRQALYTFFITRCKQAGGNVSLY